MGTDVQLRFDYEALDTQTRAFVLDRTERIHNLARMTATAIVQVGQALTEVKERLGHGKFLAWIEKEFAWSDPSAERFMRVYRNLKSVKLTNMEIDVSALYLIAAPSTPEPVRAEVIRRAENGERVTHAGTRALVQRFAETGEVPKVEVSLPQLIAERRRLLEPEPVIRKLSARERAEQEQMRANSERVVSIMLVIEAIKRIAHTEHVPTVIAADLIRFHSRDGVGRANVARAIHWLTGLQECLLCDEKN